MDDFRSLRKKYNSFDWEFYSSNYFDEDKNRLSLNKDDCWWHYLTIGLKEKFLFFDIKDSMQREEEADDLDWETYRSNYNLDENVFSSKYHVLWHWENIGKINGFLYFSLKNQYESNKLKNNFDIEFYSKKYSFLDIPKKNTWWHYLNYGTKLGYLYFNKLDSCNSNLKQNNSLSFRNNYFKQFENNILLYIPITYIISKKLNIQKYYYYYIQNMINHNYNYNIYLVKFDTLLNKLIHLSEKEYSSLIEKKCIPDNIFYYSDYEKIDFYYQKIKNNTNNIFLCDLNIFPTECNKFKSLYNVIKNNTKCGFYNGNIYFEKLNETSSLLKDYYWFISKFNIILTPSDFFSQELSFHLNKYGMSFPDHLINYETPVLNNIKNLKENIEMEKNSYILIFVNLNDINAVNFIISLKNILPENNKYQLLISLDETYKNIILNKKLNYLLNNKHLIINNFYKFVNNAEYCIFYNFNINLYNKLKYCLSKNKICVCNSKYYSNKIINNFNINIVNFENINLLKDLFKTLLSPIKNIKYNNCYFETWEKYSSQVINIINNKNNNLNNYNKITNTNLFIYIEKNSTIHLYSYFLNLLVNICKENNVSIAFVKWNIETEKIELIDYNILLSIINTENEFTFLLEKDNLSMNKITDEKSVLLFIDNINLDFNIKINNYINNLNIKTLFIYNNYYDFNDVENSDYRSFIFLNLLSSYKIIISQFVKENISLLLTKYNFLYQFPVEKIIDLPFNKDVEKENLIIEKKIKDKINIYFPSIENINIIINFLNLIRNFSQQYKINIYINEEYKDKLKKYYKFCSSLIFTSYKQKKIDFEFTKFFHYCFLDNTSVENTLILNNFLWYSVPVISFQNNNIIPQKKKGCIFIDDFNSENLISKICDKQFYDQLQDEINFIKMDSWIDYVNNIFKEIVNL